MALAMKIGSAETTVRKTNKESESLELFKMWTENARRTFFGSLIDFFAE
jgi:hypothetical protein